MTVREFIERLCKKTEDGPASGWVDRIDMLIRPSGIDRSKICWNGSPFSVAMSIYDEAARRRIMPVIEALLE